MAEPPEEPPEGLFGEPPQEPAGRYEEPPEEPAEEPLDEPSHRYPEPSEDEEPVGRYVEPPEDPGSHYREPPEEPGHRFSEPPTEEEPGHRFGESPAPEEPGHRFAEPPTPEEPGHGFGESPAPEEPGHGFGEPPAPEEPGHRFSEPPAPEGSGHGFGEPPTPEGPGHRFSEPPAGEEWRSRYRESTEEPAGSSHEGPPDLHGLRDHPTGELSDDQLDHPTGEFFDDESPEDRAVSPPGDLLGDLGEEVHSTAELAQRRAQERAQRRRAGRQRLLVLIGGLVVVVVIIVLVVNGGSGTPTTTTTSGNPLAATGTGAGHLLAGSSTSALAGNILVADRNNNRVVALTPQGRLVWTARLTGPSNAFPSSTGRSITVTQPGAFVVLQLAVADRKAFYRYGHSGHPGSSNDHLRDPATAQELSDGRLVIADKSNCRILFLTPPKHSPTTKLGTPGSCVHAPPKSLAYPDSVFPAVGGGIVVTELDPKWVDVLSATGTVVAMMQVPGLSAPDDAYEYSKDKLIATSHTHPGVVEEFNTADKVTWTYDPTSGAGELDRPSLAEVLPDGDVLVCDSGNDRVVVIDPQTDTIIWQYGHTGKPGSKPGYLHTPDSAVLVP